MLTKLEFVALCAVIAISGAAAWTASQQLSSMSLTYGKPGIGRSFPASAFGGARPFLREEGDSFDELPLGPFSQLCVKGAARGDPIAG
jgi:hypothetical protein